MPTGKLPEFRKHGFDKKFVPLEEGHIMTPAPSTKTIIQFISDWTATPFDHLKILDLGCGRGELVAALRGKGARAYGIEIDPRFVESGSILSRTYSDDYPILSVIDHDGRSIFPDNYFDLVVSDQVFEHVSNLKSVTDEIARVLRPAGLTCHQFPARFRVVEPHYKLPLAHWLPKTPVRKAAIKALLAAGLSHQFFPEYSLDDRTSIIFKYSVEETFYRRTKDIERAFIDSGLSPSVTQGMNAYVESRLHRRIHHLIPLARLVGLFGVVMFTAQKPLALPDT